MRKDEDEVDATERDMERHTWTVNQHTKRLLADAQVTMENKIKDLRHVCKKSSDPAVRAAYVDMVAAEETVNMLFTGRPSDV